MKQALKYAAGAIGLYLVVVYATGAQGVLGSGGGAIANVVSAFQGRSASTATKIP